jgi:hypothetical protein
MNRRRFVPSWRLWLLCLLGVFLPVKAADVFWANPAGGNWNVATNWSPVGVPAAGDNVFITAAGTYTVTLNVSATVGSLTVGGSSGTQRLTNSTTANMLTLNGPGLIAADGVLGMTAGTVTGPGELTVQGRFLWNGGTLSGLGRTVVSANGSLEIGGAAAKTLSGRALVNSGRITWTGTGNIAFGVGVITNEVTGVFELQNNESISDSDGTGTPADLYNFGTVRKTTGTGTSTVTGVPVHNSGLISVESGTLSLAGVFDNAGTCQVELGALNLSGGGAHSGPFEAAALGVVNFAGGQHTLAAGVQLTGAGTHRVSATGTTLNLATDVEASNFELTAGTVAGSSDLTITNTFTWSGGTVSGAGALILPVASVVNLSGTANKILSGRTLRNAGTITWTGTGNLQFNSGVIENQTTGVFDAQNNEQVIDGDGAATTATFSNAGTFRKTVGTATTTFTTVLFNNTGNVQVEGGTLAFAGGISSGRFSATVPGAIVSFAAGTHTLEEGAALTGLGVSRVGAAGTTVTIAGAVGAEQFELTAGTLTGAGTLTVSNRFEWSGGTLSGAGAVTIPSGSLLNLSGASTKTLAGRTLNHGGTCTWTGTGNFSFSSGAFNNQPGALFDVQNDRTISDPDGTTSPATFHNAGTFRKSVATGATSFSNVAFHNAGLLELQSGTLNLAGGTSSGTFDVASASAILTFAGGTHTLNSGARLQGPGIVRLASGGVTLDIAGDVNAVRFEFANGTLTGTGTFGVTSTFTWSGGTMAGTGITSIPAGGTLTLPGTAGLFLNGRTLNLAGQTIWSSTTDLTFNRGTINNLAGAVFEIRNDRTIWDTDGANTVATFNNAGLIRKTTTTGETPINGVVFNNTGTIELQNWSLAASGPFNNDGVCALQNGRLTLSGGGSSGGRFDTQSADSRVIFSYGNHTLKSGAQLAGQGTNEIRIGTVDITGAVGVRNLLLADAATLTGSGTLTVTNHLRWEYGTMSGSGVTTLLPGSQLEMNGVSLNVSGRTVNNGGTAVITGLFTSLGLNSGVFNNLAGATFDIQGDFGITDPNGPATPAVFNNAGTLRKSGSGGDATVSDVTLNNSGILEIQSGRLSVGGPFHHTGTCAVPNGTLNLAGGGTSSAPFNVGSGAVVEFTGGTNTLAAGTSFSGGGTVRLDGFDTRVEVAAALSLPRFEQAGGTLAGAGTLTVTSVYDWDGGTQGGAGTTVIPAGATLNLRNAAGTVTLAGRTLQNGGTAVWSGSGGFGAGQFTSGLLHNLAGATFDAQVDGAFDDTDGPGTVAEFRNAGTYRKSAGSGTMSLTGVRFENSGTVRLESGVSYLGSYHQTAGSTLLTGGGLEGSLVDVAGGTLSGSGTISATNIVNAAEFRPGSSPGALTIQGPYLQTAQGKLVIEIAGPTAGVDHDLLTVNGPANLAGELAINLLSGYRPPTNTTFVILPAFPITGRFSSVTGGDAGGGIVLRERYTPTAVVLEASAGTNVTTNIEFEIPVLQGNNALFQLTGTAGATFELQGSTNLTDWVTLTLVTNAGPTYNFVVTNVTLLPRAFFRTKQ